MDPALPDDVRCPASGTHRAPQRRGHGRGWRQGEPQQARQQPGWAGESVLQEEAMINELPHHVASLGEGEFQILRGEVRQLKPTKKGKICNKRMYCGSL